MKTKFYLLFIHAFISQLVCAQNLVSNGDFENYSALPSDYGQTYLCSGWSNVNGGIGSGPYGSPDYLHSLGSGGVELPNSIYGTVSPHSGEAIMGFITCADSKPNFREYLSTQLSSPTLIGKTYTVSFWLTNGSANQLNAKSSNRIGLRFSSSPLSQVSDEPIGGIPQLEIPNEVWTTTWQQFSFTFIADSSYNFITIGNFYDDASTSTSTQVNATFSLAYYFIDNIEIIPQSLDIISANSFCLGDPSVFNFSYLNPVDSVFWNFDDPLSGNANTSTDLSPTHVFTNPGTYNVRLMAYSGTNIGMVEKPILITDDCAIALELPNVITANGLFVPTVSKGIASMKTTIYNRWGNTVFETNKLSIEWDGQECSDGTYFWIVYYTDENGKEDKLEGVVTLIR